MDSKDQFKHTILEYYKKNVSQEFPKELLDRVATKLADEFYKEYSEFRKQYPKSAKRYSTFHVKDLDHPYTYESIVEFLKTEMKSDYQKYAGELLSMNESELRKFEQSREDFYNMF